MSDPDPTDEDDVTPDRPRSGGHPQEQQPVRPERRGPGEESAQQ